MGFVHTTPIYAERTTVLATVCHLLWGVLVSASYVGCQLDLEVIDILVAISLGIPREFPEFFIITTSPPLKGRFWPCLPKVTLGVLRDPRLPVYRLAKKFPVTTYHLLILRLDRFCTHKVSN